MNEHKNDRKKGLSALVESQDDFSILDAIGGVRGIVESMLPGLLFVIMFVITRDTQLTVIVSAVLAIVQVLFRLIQRQSVMGALSGLIAVAICLVWAWTSGQARNYYSYGIIVNSLSAVLLIISLLVRIPMMGIVLECFRKIPTGNLGLWLQTWRNDKPLLRAYMITTCLWLVLFVLRVCVQAPLYLSNQVVLLGTVRLIMGLPLWALLVWVSYLIIANPLHRNEQQRKIQAQVDSSVRMLNKED